MSVFSWKNGLISLLEYARKINGFLFLKTAVDILICGECNCETSENILYAAAGDERISTLISDCLKVLVKGAHTVSVIQILESRLSRREFAALKMKCPGFFPTKESFYADIKGKKPLSENCAVLEELLSYSDKILKNKLFYSERQK